MTTPAQFGVAKPEPATFRSCLTQLGLTANAVLFIDDNVDGAIAAGLHAHHYRDIAALSALLHDLDLLDPCPLEPDHAP